VTDHSNQLLCGLLDRLEPGWLPQEIFHAIARLVVTPTYVVIPQFRRDDRVFVHLCTRASNDPYYASLLNPIGTVLRSTDKSLSAVYQRLLAAELPGAAVRRGPRFVDVAFDMIARGREISLIHWVELAEGAPSHLLFDVAVLPANVVPTDYRRIEVAAAHFRATVAAEEDRR